MKNKFKKLIGIQDVYIRGNDMVITGQPADCEDDNHDCDVMGCGSLGHVILRGQFLFVQKGYSEKTQETEDE